MSAINEATPIGDDEKIDWFGKIGNLIDCVIPIILSLIAASSLVLVAFGFIH